MDVKLRVYGLATVQKGGEARKFPHEWMKEDYVDWRPELQPELHHPRLMKGIEPTRNFLLHPGRLCYASRYYLCRKQPMAGERLRLVLVLGVPFRDTPDLGGICLGAKKVEGASRWE